MAHTFEYAILMAVPDPRRGERVNVGLAVFLPDRVDVRFAAVSKIAALVGGNWTSYTEEVKRRLLSQRGPAAAEMIAANPQIDPVIQASDLAFLSVEGASEYEKTVNEILNALVIKPRAEIHPRTTRINTEIAREFRREHILADTHEPIESKKVVRDFIIEDELKADFALQNGILHVAATLDLRRPTVDIKEPALKAVVLDRAKKQHGPEVQCIGVYAVGEMTRQHFKTHLELLNDYADVVYNWADTRGKREFSSTILSAYGTDRLGRFA